MFCPASQKPRIGLPLRGFFTSSPVLPGPHWITDLGVFSMKSFVLLTAWVWVMCLSGCTVLAIADAAGSAVVYGVKTTVNVLDAVTPDIVNKKK
jgi:hypothetical protein